MHKKYHIVTIKENLPADKILKCPLNVINHKKYDRAIVDYSDFIVRIHFTALAVLLVLVHCIVLYGDTRRME